MSDYLTYFDIIIAVYLLFYAIKGNGSAYNNDYPEDMQPEFRRTTRLFLWIAGGGMLVLSILELYLQTTVIAWANIIYVAVCVIIWLVYAKVHFGGLLKKRNAKK